MALDLYVGALARYYSREWENVMQVWARENGVEYHLVSPDGANEPPPDWNDVFSAVERWIRALNSGLDQHLSQPLSWDESRDSPYFTDRPGYDGYGGLLVWAAYSEAGREAPERYEKDWYEDDVFLEFHEADKANTFRAILAADLWLPGDFQFSFDFENPVGNKVHIASSERLQVELNRLNKQTLGIEHIDAATLPQPSAEEGASLRELAIYGLAVFKELCDKSVEHQLPMFLDT